MGSVDTELGRLKGTGSQRSDNISLSKGWGLSLDNPLGYVVQKNDKLAFWKIALMGMWIMSCKEKEPEAGRPVERGDKEMMRT